LLNLSRYWTFVDNSIGADGAKALADVLKTNTTLMMLNLGCTLLLL